MGRHVSNEETNNVMKQQFLPSKCHLRLLSKAPGLCVEEIGYGHHPGRSGSELDLRP